MGNIISATERLIIREIEEMDRENALRLTKATSEFPYVSMSEELLAVYNEACWNEINAPEIFNGMISLKESGDF